GPARSAYVPDWSFITPILITPSEICACAPAAKAKAATTHRLILRDIAVAPIQALKYAPRLDAEVLVQLIHARFECGVGDHVHHAPILHYVVTVRHRLG